jgi:hypothetical protein
VFLFSVKLEDLKRGKKLGPKLTGGVGQALRSIKSLHAVGIYSLVLAVVFLVVQIKVLPRPAITETAVSMDALREAPMANVVFLDDIPSLSSAARRYIYSAPDIDSGADKLMLETGIRSAITPEISHVSVIPAKLVAPPDSLEQARFKATMANSVPMDNEVMKSYNDMCDGLSSLGGRATCRRLLRVLRSSVPTTSRSLLKLRLEEEPLDFLRLRHFAAVWTLANSFARLPHFTVLDVDNCLNDSMPSISDITLRLHTWGGKTVVLFIDITSIKDISEKVSKMSLFCGLQQTDASSAVYGAVATFSSSPVDKITLVSEESLLSELSFSRTEHLAAIKIGKLVAKETGENLTTSLKKLSDTLSISVTDKLVELVKGEVGKTCADGPEYLDNALAALLEKVPEGVKAEFEAIAERLPASVHANDGRQIPMLRELLDFFQGLTTSGMASLEAGSPASDIISFLLSAVPAAQVKSDPTLHNTPVPVTLGSVMSEVTPENVSILESGIMELDVFTKLYNGCVSMVDTSVSKKGIVLLTDGKVLPLRAQDSPDFTKKQTLATHFPPDVAGYAQRPFKVAIRWVRSRKDLVTSELAIDTLTDLEHKQLSMDNTNEAYLTEFVKETVEVYSDSAYMLVNPSVASDESFSKMLEKRLGGHAHNEKEGRAVVDMDELESLTRDYMDYIADMVIEPKTDESNSYLKEVGTMASKIALLKEVTTHRGVSKIIESFMPRLVNGFTVLADADYRFALGFSGSLHSKTADNLYTIVSCKPYLRWNLVLVNANALSFKTTWMKEYCVSFGRGARYSKLGSCATPPGQDKNDWSHSVPSSVGPRKNGHVDMVFETGTLAGYFTSKWVSFDRNRLDWMLDKPLKLLPKLFSIHELRSTSYLNSEGTRNHLGIRVPTGIDLGSFELAYNSASSFVNRQQYTIGLDLWKYAHQAISGHDNNMLGLIEPISSLVCRTPTELITYSNITMNYILSMFSKTCKSKKSVFAENNEPFVAQPCLLYASNNPEMNMLSYADVIMYNKDKFNKHDGEAACVLNFKRQQINIDRVRSIPNIPVEGSLDGLNVYAGASLSLLDKVLEEDIGTLDDLATLASDNSTIISGEVAAVFSNDPTIPYAGSFWFEVKALVDMRLSQGSAGSVSSMSGRGIKDFFTTKGSFWSVGGVPVFEDITLRKASAMLHVIRECLGIPIDNEVEGAIGKLSGYDWRTELARVLAEGKDMHLDKYELLHKILDGSVTCVPDIMTSDKDQVGKFREISKLAIAFAITQSIMEDLYKPLSGRTEEDIITSSDKENEIMHFVLDAMHNSSKKINEETFFLNRDKKAFGPNKKITSFLLSHSILSPDKATFEYLCYCTFLNMTKEVHYPKQVVSTALGVRKVYQGAGKSVATGVTRGREFMNLYSGSKTSSVLMSIVEEYEETGKASIRIEDGMPGQGINGITSSVAVTAVERYSAVIIKRAFNAKYSSRVTSDDVLNAITASTHQAKALKPVMRMIVARLGACAALIENTSKFTLTSNRPEMNQLVMLNSRLVVPVTKIAVATCRLDSGGNFAEDMVAAGNASCEALRKGCSQSLSCFICLVLQSSVVDLHRFWPVVSNFLTPKDDSMFIASRIPQLFGLPANSPIAASITPFGPIALIPETLPPNLTVLYAPYLASKVFGESHVLDAGLATDTRATTMSKSKYVEMLLPGAVAEKENMAEPLHVPTAIYSSTITGTKGVLRRQSHTVKLSRQFGNSLVDLCTTGVFSRMENGVRTTMTSVLSNYSSLLHKGEREFKPHIIAADMTHGRNFKSVRVLPECFFSFETSRVSPREIALSLQNPEKVKSALKAFGSRLLLGKSGPVSELESNLLKFFANDVEQANLYNVALSVVNVELDKNSHVHVEHFKKMKRHGVRTMKAARFRKTTRYKPLTTCDINKVDLHDVLLSYYISPSELCNLPISLRNVRGGPKGTMTATRAMIEAGLVATRVLSSMPRQMTMHGFGPGKAHKQIDVVEALVRYNTLMGSKTKNLPSKLSELRQMRAYSLRIEFGNGVSRSELTTELIECLSFAVEDILLPPYAVGSTSTSHLDSKGSEPVPVALLKHKHKLDLIPMCIAKRHVLCGPEDIIRLVTMPSHKSKFIRFGRKVSRLLPVAEIVALNGARVPVYHQVQTRLIANSIGYTHMFLALSTEPISSFRRLTEFTVLPKTEAYIKVAWEAATRRIAIEGQAFLNSASTRYNNEEVVVCNLASLREPRLELSGENVFVCGRVGLGPGQDEGGAVVRIHYDKVDISSDLWSLAIKQLAVRKRAEQYEPTSSSTSTMSAPTLATFDDKLEAMSMFSMVATTDLLSGIFDWGNYRDEYGLTFEYLEMLSRKTADRLGESGQQKSLAELTTNLFGSSRDLGVLGVRASMSSLVLNDSVYSSIIEAGSAKLAMIEPPASPGFLEVFRRLVLLRCAPPCRLAFMVMLMNKLSGPSSHMSEPRRVVISHSVASQLGLGADLDSTRSVVVVRAPSYSITREMFGHTVDLIFNEGASAVIRGHIENLASSVSRKGASAIPQSDPDSFFLDVDRSMDSLKQAIVSSALEEERERRIVSDALSSTSQSLRSAGVSWADM